MASPERTRGAVAEELARDARRFVHDRRGPQVPTASFTHFLVKLSFAAPASFLSAADFSRG
jgi:hypothetical protein